MAETQQKQQKSSPVGGVIVLLVAVAAIVCALVLGGMRYFGDDSTSDDNQNQSDSNEGDTSFQTTLWPATWQKLNSFTAGTLLSGTDAEYVPAEDSLSTFVGKTEGAYGYPNSETKIDKAALSKLTAMFLAMNGSCTFEEANDVNRAYATQVDDEYKTALTVRIRLKKAGGTNVLLSDATVTGGEAPDVWMAANAWKYGFINRYPNSQEDSTKDVYRYVGLPHAYYITNVMTATVESTPDSGDGQTDADTTASDEVQEPQQALLPTLDAYLELVRTKTAEKPLVIEVKGALTADQTAEGVGALEKAGNGTYAVFYVAKADADNAQVPMDAQLVSVSDDGAGYIVTVQIMNKNEKS